MYYFEMYAIYYYYKDVVTLLYTGQGFSLQLSSMEPSNECQDKGGEQ